MRSRARPGAATFALLLAVQAPDARANGRFPHAQIVRELGSADGSAGGALLIAGTYGLLVSVNAGRDFSWVCESELFGKPPGTYTIDPLLELAPDGSFLSGSLEGARVSSDRGCTFTHVDSLPRAWSFFETSPPPGAETGRVIDLSRRGSDESAPLLALVALLDERGFASEHRLYQAADGSAFERTGAAIPLSMLDYGLTLHAAPSDPDRIYVSGTLANDPVLVRSSDGGGSWVESAVTAEDAASVIGAYLGGVSPSDPDRVYLRVPRRVDTLDGLYRWDDSLLVSSDGGASFSDVLRRQANLLGFALSPDGGTVLAGYGDPRISMVLSAASDFGIYAADAQDLAFALIADLEVSCLFWGAAGLYACATERDPLGLDPALAPDFHLGLYPGSGLPSSRADFMPWLKLAEVGAPAPWSDGRPNACDGEWFGTAPEAPSPLGACAGFNACDPRPRSPDALVCGPPAAGGGGGEAGSAALAPGSDPGCGFRTSRRAPPFGGAFALLFAGVVGFRRWLRRAQPGAGAGAGGGAETVKS